MALSKSKLSFIYLTIILDKPTDSTWLLFLVYLSSIETIQVPIYLGFQIYCRFKIGGDYMVESVFIDDVLVERPDFFPNFNFCCEEVGNGTRYILYLHFRFPLENLFVNCMVLVKSIAIRPRENYILIIGEHGRRLMTRIPNAYILRENI